MDDTQLKQAKGKLTALDRSLSDLAVRQRSTEGKLAQEHQIVRQSASQRAVLVSKLVDAGEEESRKLHKAIDGMDSAIKSAERQAEALQHLLRSIAAETASTTSERDQLNAVVASESNSRAFQQWTETMQANFAEATAAMEQARLTLGRLTVAAANGVERFKGAAGNWTASRFDEFERLQSNPESLLGFRQALPWYRSIIVHVSPMTRG